MKKENRWWDFGWQLVEGCDPVSEGCKNCWSLAKEKRFRKESGIVCHKERLERPLHRKKSARYAIWNDLFHPQVPFEFIDKIFAVMALCPQHQFQLLTKRADRMAEYFKSKPWTEIAASPRIGLWFLGYRQYKKDNTNPPWCDVRWPLPNVHLGVTVENQEMADKRIPILLSIPAAKRFISIEPLLSEIDIRQYLRAWGDPFNEGRMVTENVPDLLIVGCESGAHHRYCKPEWIKSLIEQADAAGVAVFVKQMEINGNVEHNINKFPVWARLREYPK